LTRRPARATTRTSSPTPGPCRGARCRQADRVDGARAEADIEHLLCVEADGVLDGGNLLERLRRRQPDGPGRPDVVSATATDLLTRRHHRPARREVEHTQPSAFVSRTVFSGACSARAGERDVFGHVAPLTHAGGMFVLPTWLKGGTNVVLRVRRRAFAAAVRTEKHRVDDGCPRCSTC